MLLLGSGLVMVGIGARIVVIVMASRIYRRWDVEGGGSVVKG